jgi:hypothetical protein
MRAHEADILVGYGQSLSSAHVAPDDATAFLANLIHSGRTNLAEVAKLDEELVKIEREVALLKEKAEDRKGAAHAKVTAVLFAQQAATIELRLVYRTCAFHALGILSRLRCGSGGRGLVAGELRLAR